MSPMLNESRVMKETNSLIQLKLVDEVRILGIWHTGLNKVEIIDRDRVIIRLSTILRRIKIKKSVFRKMLSVLGLVELFTKYFIGIVKYRPHFISCHNLLLLPVCTIGKRITKSKLIYLPHELETERMGMSGIQRLTSSYIERIFIKYADNIVVVCEPIAKWYSDNYRIHNVHVLRNVPFNPFLDTPLVKSRKLRDEFFIPDSDLIFIYQGVIDRTRGCIELLEVFREVDPTKHIVMMGYGDMEEAIVLAATEYDNIHFKKAVSVEEIIQYTSSADIGIVYLPFELPLSYKHSMSNKFFEYLIGGLPVVLSSNLEYMCNEIQTHNLGWILKPDQISLFSFVNSVNKESIKDIEVKKYADKSAWQLEHDVLKIVYSS